MLVRLLRALVSPNSYGLVLVLIVVTYVIAAGEFGRVGSTTFFAAQIITVWFALRTSRARRPVRAVALVLMAYAVVAAIAGAVSSGVTDSVWVVLAAGLLYLIAPFSIVRHIGERPQVDQETMLGAIAAYLLIGMTFAFAYRVLEVSQSGPFFGSGGEGTLSQTLFFSFTTLTTTGYGNLVPAANPGQTLAVGEMILGQLFLITALGKIVSAWRPRRWAAEPSSSETAPGR
jgi:hypothetical protein